MAVLTIVPLGESGVQILPPDIVWFGKYGDFALVTDPSQGGAGGLQGQAPIQSAVLMLLFSDGRADPGQLRFEHAGDRRGWPGDGFDIDTAAGEAPLGSLLWLFRRHELSDQTAAEVEAEAQRALQPLIKQRAVARIDSKATALKAENLLRLDLALWGRDGTTLWAPQFDVLWRKSPPW